jgi:hypothetical protein
MQLPPAVPDAQFPEILFVCLEIVECERSASEVTALSCSRETYPTRGNLQGVDVQTLSGRRSLWRFEREPINERTTRLRGQTIQKRANDPKNS